MIEYNTRRDQIRSPRTQRVIGRWVASLCDDLAVREIIEALRIHWRALVQAALLTFAVVVAVHIHPVPIGAIVSAVRGRMPGSGQHGWWYVAAVAVLVSASLDGIAGLFMRLKALRAWSWVRMVSAVFAIVMIGGSGNADPFPSLMCFVGVAVLFWSAFACFRTTWKAPTEIEDLLHRRYFANRVAEVFVDPEKFQRLNRVAILGEWGAGKSRVLDLIAERLTAEKSRKFVIARVNPWKASTAGDAWAVIAAEIDRALGYRPMAPKLRQAHPLLAAFFDAFPSLGISKDLLKLIAVDGHQLEKKLVDRINKRLEGIRERVVVLVDDMERTDPLILRQLFPVIDQLAGIRHAAFVFAIDPTKVAEAFGESSRAGGNTKGYLDKIFDLQIELPDPEPEDVHALMLSQAQSFRAEKLAAALPLIKAYLPMNPRIALRFVEFSVSNEHLFLSRYGPNEKNYAVVFLMWLAEIEFPGFMDKFGEHESRFRALTSSDRMQTNESPQNDEFSAISDAMKVSFGESHQGRLMLLINGIIDLCALGGMPVCSPGSQVRWAKSGFKVLMEMSTREIGVLRERWIQSNSSKSIHSLIDDFFGGSKSIQARGLEFINKEECAKQLVDGEVALFLDWAQGSVHAGDCEWACENQQESACVLRNHLRASIENKWPLEQAIFSWKLLRAICHRPALDDIEEGGAPRVVDERIGEVRAFLFQLIEFLPLQDAWNVAWELRKTFEKELSSTGRAPLKQSKLREEMRVKIVGRMREFVITCLYDGDVDSLVARGGMAESDGLRFFWDPENWLSGPGVIEKTMAKLLTDAKGNERLAKQCARVVLHLFLEQAKQRGMKSLQTLDQTYPGYITGFWMAAMQLPESHKLKRAMLEEWALALAAQNDPVAAAESFRQIFPRRFSE